MKSNDYGKVYFLKSHSYKDKTFSALHEINSNFDLLKSIELGTGRAVGITSNDELLEWKYEKKSTNQKRHEFPFLLSKPVYHFHKIKFAKVLLNKTMCLGLDVDGNVLVWGEHKEGVLGLGYTINQVENPTKLESLRDICEIALSENHAIAINNVGEAYSWGIGKYGELGLEKSIYTPTPLRVNGNKLYSKVIVGNLITCFLDAQGHFSYFGVIIKILKGSYSNITVKNLLSDQDNSDPNILFQEKIIDELENEPFVNVSIGNGFIALLSKKGMVYTLEYSDKLTALYSKYFVYSLTVSNNQIFGLSYDKNLASSQTQSLNDHSTTQFNTQLYYLSQWVSKAADQEVSSEVWNTIIYKITEELHLDNILLLSTNNHNVILFFEKGMNLNTSVLIPNNRTNVNISHDISWDNITYNEMPQIMRKGTQNQHFLVFDSEYDDSYNMKFKRSKLNQSKRNASPYLNRTLSEAKSANNILPTNKSCCTTILCPYTERSNKRLFGSDSSNKKHNNEEEEEENSGEIDTREKDLQHFQKEFDSIISNLKCTQREKSANLKQKYKDSHGRLQSIDQEQDINLSFSTERKRQINNNMNNNNKAHQMNKKHILSLEKNLQTSNKSNAFGHLDTSNPNIETKNNMSDIEGLFNKTNTEMRNDLYSDIDQEVNLFNKSNMLDESNQLKLSSNFIYVNPNKGTFMSPQIAKNKKMNQLYSSSPNHQRKKGNGINTNLDEELLNKVALTEENQPYYTNYATLNAWNHRMNSQDLMQLDEKDHIVYYNTDGNEANVNDAKYQSQEYQHKGSRGGLYSTVSSGWKSYRNSKSQSYNHSLDNMSSRNRQYGKEIFDIDEEEGNGHNYYKSNESRKKYFYLTKNDENDDNKPFSDRKHYVPGRDALNNQDNDYINTNLKMIKLNRQYNTEKTNDSHKMSTIRHMENSSNFVGSNDNMFDDTHKQEGKSHFHQGNERTKKNITNNKTTSGKYEKTDSKNELNRNNANEDDDYENNDNQNEYYQSNNRTSKNMQKNNRDNNNLQRNSKDKENISNNNASGNNMSSHKKTNNNLGTSSGDNDYNLTNKRSEMNMGNNKGANSRINQKNIGGNYMNRDGDEEYNKEEEEKEEVDDDQVDNQGNSRRQNNNQKNNKANSNMYQNDTNKKNINNKENSTQGINNQSKKNEAMMNNNKTNNTTNNSSKQNNSINNKFNDSIQSNNCINKRGVSSAKYARNNTNEEINDVDQEEDNDDGNTYNRKGESSSTQMKLNKKTKMSQNQRNNQKMYNDDNDDEQQEEEEGYIEGKREQSKMTKQKSKRDKTNNNQQQEDDDEDNDENYDEIRDNTLKGGIINNKQGYTDSIKKNNGSSNQSQCTPPQSSSKKNKWNDQDNNLLFSFDPAKQRLQNQIQNKDPKMKDYDDIIDEVKKDESFRKAFSANSSKLDENSEENSRTFTAKHFNKTSKSKNALAQSEEDLKEELRLKQFENFSNDKKNKQQKSLYNEKEQIQENNNSDEEESGDNINDQNRQGKRTKGKKTKRRQQSKRNDDNNNNDNDVEDSNDNNDEEEDENNDENGGENNNRGENKRIRVNKKKLSKKGNDMNDSNKDGNNNSKTKKNNNAQFNNNQDDDNYNYDDPNMKHINSPRQTEDLYSFNKRSNNNTTNKSSSSNNQQSGSTNVFNYSTNQQRHTDSSNHKSFNDTARLGGRDENLEDTSDKNKRINQSKNTNTNQSKPNNNDEEEDDTHNNNSQFTLSTKKSLIGKINNQQQQYSSQQNNTTNKSSNENNKQLTELLAQQKIYYSQRNNNNNRDDNEYQREEEYHQNYQSNTKQHQTSKKKRNEIMTDNLYNDNYSNNKRSNHIREQSPSEGPVNEKRNSQYQFDKLTDGNMDDVSYRFASLPVSKETVINPEDTFGVNESPNNEKGTNKKEGKNINSQTFPINEKGKDDGRSTDKKLRGSLSIKIPNDESIINLPKKGSNSLDKEEDDQDQDEDYQSNNRAHDKMVKSNRNNNTKDQKIFTLKGSTGEHDLMSKGSKTNKQSNHEGISNKASNNQQYNDDNILDTEDSVKREAARAAKLITNIKKNHSEIEDSLEYNNKLHQKNEDDNDFHEISSNSNKLPSNPNNENVYTFSGVQNNTKGNRPGNNQKTVSQNQSSYCSNNQSQNPSLYQSQAQSQTQSQQSLKKTQNFNNKNNIQSNQSNSDSFQHKYNNSNSQYAQSQRKNMNKNKRDGEEYINTNSNKNQSFNEDDNDEEQEEEDKYNSESNEEINSKDIKQKKKSQSKRENRNYPQIAEEENQNHSKRRNQKLKAKNNNMDTPESEKADKNSLMSLLSESKNSKEKQTLMKLAMQQARIGGKLVINKHYLNYFIYLMNIYMKKRIALHVIKKVARYQSFKEKRYACRILYRLTKKRIIFYKIKFYHRVLKIYKFLLKNK